MYGVYRGNSTIIVYIKICPPLNVTTGLRDALPIQNGVGRDLKKSCFKVIKSSKTTYQNDKLLLIVLLGIFLKFKTQNDIYTT